MSNQQKKLEQFIEFEIGVPWGHLTCRWHGNRAVRPLLAIHGWMDNMGTFARLLPLLPDHVGVLCVELPGHGRSSCYPAGMQYSVLEWTAIIRRVVRHYGWSRVSLMGHSFGAVACNLYAAFFPHEVDLIVAMDLLTVPFKSSDFFINYMGYSVECMLKPPRAPKLYTAVQLDQARWGPGPSLSSKEASHLIARCSAAATDQPGHFCIARDARLVHYNRFPSGTGLILEANRRIRNIPYLVIKASRSSYMDDGLILALSLLRRQNPDFEFHVVHGAHHVHLSDPQQVAKLIGPFLVKHRPPEQVEQRELPKSKL